jgi:thiol-disulfide isomerase/thioredoxin
MKPNKSTKVLVIISLCFIYLIVNGQGKISRKNTIKYDSSNHIQKPNSQVDTLGKEYLFKDTLDRPVCLSSFKGKFVFIDIWYSGCGFCISANRALRIVHEQMKNENIVFLSISVDVNKEKWLTSITENAKPSKLNPWAGKYCPATGTVILYTGGNGSDNDFLKKYDPDNYYPKLLFFDPSGKLISDHPPRPDNIPDDQPEKLISFLSGYIKNK